MAGTRAGGGGCVEGGGGGQAAARLDAARIATGFQDEGPSHASESARSPGSGRPRLKPTQQAHRLTRPPSARLSRRLTGARSTSKRDPVVFAPGRPSLTLNVPPAANGAVRQWLTNRLQPARVGDAGWGRYRRVRGRQAGGRAGRCLPGHHRCPRPRPCRVDRPPNKGSGASTGTQGYRLRRWPAQAAPARPSHTLYSPPRREDKVKRKKEGGGGAGIRYHIMWVLRNPRAELLPSDESGYTQLGFGCC